jgi:nucleoporin NUP82
MLAVYETIDLGLVSALSRISASQSGPSALDLLEANHPLLLVDPIHDDTIYVYHAFGVHALHLGSVLQGLADALRAEDDEEGTLLTTALKKSCNTTVQPILTTLSVERK